MGMTIPPKYIVGYEYINKQGLDVRVVEYRGRKNITVEFEIDGAKKVTAGSYIKQGLPLHPTLGKVKVGDKFPCHDGDVLEIVEILKNSLYKVQWLSDGTASVKDLKSIKQGFNRHPTKNQPKVGDVFKTNNSGNVEVIEYINATNIVVRFEDGSQVKVCSSDLHSGAIRHKGSNLYIGSTFKTNSGWSGTIVSYKDPWNVEVLWQDGTSSWEPASHIKLGSIKPLMQPSVEGVGYFGVGEFVPGLRKEGKKADPRVYNMWVRMFSRCYNPTDMNKSRNAKYRDVHVDEDWHNFQNFAKWAYKQTMIFEENVELDKDLLSTSAKVYSKDTCCVVPSEINRFLIEQDIGTYGRGVHLIAPKTPNSVVGYVSKVNTGKGREYLGYFPLPSMAFAAYKKRKESYAKELAEKWKSRIDPRAYKALMNYTVEITD